MSGAAESFGARLIEEWPGSLLIVSGEPGWPIVATGPRATQRFAPALAVGRAFAVTLTAPSRDRLAALLDEPDRRCGSIVLFDAADDDVVPPFMTYQVVRLSGPAGSPPLWALLSCETDVGIDRRQGPRNALAPPEALQDPLTAVGHRGWFEILAPEIAVQARHLRQTAWIALADLDGFKRINAAHGHRAGDEVLRGAADALQKLVEVGDGTVRHGGDEFVSLGMRPTEAAVVAATHRLRAEFRARFERRSGPGAGLTLSLGVATIEPEDPAPWDHHLERADRALLAAKAAGGDRVALARGDAPLLLPQDEGRA